MTRTMLRVALSAAFVGALAVQGWAGETGQCIRASSAEYKDCKKTCKEDFQVAKDGCSNRDHVCVEACREERAICRDATGYDAAIDACNDARATDVATCKVIYEGNPSAIDQCIDNAQLAAFQCRDQVREDTKDALKACRTDFKTCARACPPPDPGAPPDPKQCRRDASLAYKACGAECREDFQIAKDACRNLDHACVEDCRDDRHTCKGLVDEDFDEDLAVCAATKQAAIALCNGDDGCIDQAQSLAFQCRDQAREDAKPGFAACRAAFKTCVAECGPASPSGAFLN